MYISCKHGTGSDEGGCMDCLWEDNQELNKEIKNLYSTIEKCIEAHEMSSTTHGLNLLKEVLKKRKLL